MMQAVVDRPSLAKYFAKLDPDALKATLVAEIPKGHAALRFASDEPQLGELPQLIIVPDKEIEDFYAWMSTYVDSLSPITSFIEVQTTSEVDQKSRKKSSTMSARNATLAVTLIDATIQANRARGKAAFASLPACLRTMSTVVVQGIFHGVNADELAQALTLWTKLRAELAQANSRAYDFDQVLAFWRHALPAFGIEQADSDLRLVRLNQSFLNGGRISLETWADASADLSSARGLTSLLQGPRERRLEVFDQVVKGISANEDRRDDILSVAFCGYVASLIGDGSLSIWQAILDRSNQMPTLPYWFAFYAGGSASMNFLNEERSLGRRLETLLCRHQHYDVDARELLVIRRAPSSKRDVHAENPNTVSARLSRSIVGWFTIRETTEQTSESKPEPLIPDVPAGPDPRVSEARRLLERSLALLAGVPDGSQSAQGSGPRSNKRR